MIVTHGSVSSVCSDVQVGGAGGAGRVQGQAQGRLGQLGPDLGNSRDQSFDAPSRRRARHKSHHRFVDRRVLTDRPRVAPVADDDDSIGRQPAQLGERSRRHRHPLEAGRVAGHHLSQPRMVAVREGDAQALGLEQRLVVEVEERGMDGPPDGCHDRSGEQLGGRHADGTAPPTRR